MPDSIAEAPKKAYKKFRIGCISLSFITFKSIILHVIDSSIWKNQVNIIISIFLPKKNEKK